MFKLNNWEIIGDRAFGNIYDNPKFENGSFVITSKIQSREGDIITTQNSKYKLLKHFNYKEGK